MVSKEAGKYALTNHSESESEAGPSAGPSLALEVKYPLDAGQQQQQSVRKRNKALQVRFKDICEAQNEQQREAAALQAGGRPAKSSSYKVAHRKYMTVPARRSIPNVTRSTGVQTSPDLRKRYQTFPFERKKGHTFKHAAAVETYTARDNGFVVVEVVPPPRAPPQPPRALAGRGLDEEEEEEEAAAAACGRGGVRRTRALLHTNECVATVEQHRAPAGLCSDALLLSCPAEVSALPDAPPGGGGGGGDYQLCSVPPSGNPRPRPQRREDGAGCGAKRQLLNVEEGSARTLPDRVSRVTGPLTWNSLTQVECLDSPSVRRKKGLQLNGLQSQTLPRAGAGAGCSRQPPPSPPLRATEGPPLLSPCGAGGPGGAMALGPGSPEACKQIVPVTKDGDVKAQLQVMENMISSSQETIKVLLGVIQELEKGEAHREGLSYRTGQDTANCDTCRNSACIIYSVELDFKQQEDKLQPLMKRLCPPEESGFPPLPYPQEAFTSTPKRKSKADSKKHPRWKLWFL
ncbi:inhibitory synaptic factor 2A-like [Gadus chalcogrammus]|uniref:inhibitory synaptic factor 2A-like n=1 Tax=Gadus chalcogrammus TaxID=1042646 RepID=UPI0024C49F0F|nr:inhibitory synaptic factor 2A-like [Gadus chalcogrammus]